MNKDGAGVDWESVLLVIAFIACFVTGLIVGWVTAPECEGRVVEKKVYVWGDYNERFDSVDGDLKQLINMSKVIELDYWGDPV